MNLVLAASGLRPFAITEVTSWGITREGVTVDPEDWRAGRTRAEIESSVTGSMSSNADSILLHSRIQASTEATPAFVADIWGRGWTFDPTAVGTMGSIRPRAGFAGLAFLSNPPTTAEIAQARRFLQREKLALGPYFFAGSVALGIFALAQRVSSADVDAFITEIRTTSIDVAGMPVPMANWMCFNPEWRLFLGFYENWRNQRPFPRGGVTL